MKKTMKQIRAALLAALMVVTAAGCSAGGNTAESTQAQGSSDSSAGAEIAMIADGGTIDDKGFNQGTYEGVKQYGEEKGISYKYYKPVEKTTDAYLSAMELAIEGGAKIIVAPGFRFTEAMYIAQDTWPDTKFVLLDGIPTQNGESKTNANTVGIQYAEEQAGFLAGYAAVVEGYKKLGFMGGVATPAVVRYGYGYIQGAEAAAKELGVTDVEINYYYTGTFDATPETQTLAATWYQNGTEIIFACGSGVGQSVMAAADASSGKSIGVDIDWAEESETVVTSAMKSLSGTVYQMLDKFYTDSFPGGENIVMDASNEGIELPMETSRFEKFDQAQYDELYKKLADGTFKPLRDVDEKGTSYTLDQISDGTVKVVEVK
ncbi:MAG: BMP family lipoprotein [Lachnospiraceae bacterium]